MSSRWRVETTEQFDWGAPVLCCLEDAESLDDPRGRGKGLPANHSARRELEQLREQAAELRGSVVAVTAERDAARGDVEREHSYGDQRGTDDLRASCDQQLDRLRAELTRAREVPRDQRSRADRAETARARSASGGRGPKAGPDQR